MAILFRHLMRPSRFLVICASCFAIMFTVLVINAMVNCRTEELDATKTLLQRYAEQLQELKTEQIKLRNTLKETREQLSAVRSSGTSSSWINGLPVIYAITPTHARFEQKADLTRLSHTFLLVRNIHWIVIEDAEFKTNLVAKFLKQTGLNYTHLSVLTPPAFKLDMEDPNWLKPRGVLQRNAGLTWLRNNTSPEKQQGVVYFADDDNTYSLKLFDEMRFTKKVSVWPVGLVGYLRYERPVVEDGKVTGWFTYWKPSRPFPMDMAGFAVNLRLFHEYPKASFTNSVQRGYQESTLLTGLKVSQDELEPKANNCTEVLVWHTRTEKSKMKNEEKMVKIHGKGSDPNIEV